MAGEERRKRPMAMDERRRKKSLDVSAERGASPVPAAPAPD